MEKILFLNSAAKQTTILAALPEDLDSFTLTGKNNYTLLAQLFSYSKQMYSHTPITNISIRDYKDQNLPQQGTLHNACNANVAGNCFKVK